MAEAISNVFVEIVLAPNFELEALNIFKKKKNIRVLEIGSFEKRSTNIEVRNVDGGLLVQNVDTKILYEKDLKIVSETQPSDENIQTSLFAWRGALLMRCPTAAMIVSLLAVAYE